MKLLPLIVVVAMYYGNVSVGHGSKGRIGIKYDPARHRIVTVFKHTPAEEAGLRVGDIVLHVDASDITGPSYTKVHLTLRRGTRIFTVELERIPKELVDEHQISEDSEERQDIDPNIDPKNC
jgi:C-terminal processing protease CtpA/Prc